METVPFAYNTPKSSRAEKYAQLLQKLTSSCRTTYELGNTAASPPPPPAAAASFPYFPAPQHTRAASRVCHAAVRPSLAKEEKTVSVPAFHERSASSSLLSSSPSSMPSSCDTADSFWDASFISAVSPLHGKGGDSSGKGDFHFRSAARAGGQIPHSAPLFEVRIRQKTKKLPSHAAPVTTFTEMLGERDPIEPHTALIAPALQSPLAFPQVGAATGTLHKDSNAPQCRGSVTAQNLLSSSPTADDYYSHYLALYRHKDYSPEHLSNKRCRLRSVVTPSCALASSTASGGLLVYPLCPPTPGCSPILAVREEQENGGGSPDVACRLFTSASLDNDDRY